MPTQPAPRRIAEQRAAVDRRVGEQALAIAQGPGKVVM
jgi:hypothetical protein